MNRAVIGLLAACCLSIVACSNSDDLVVDVFAAASLTDAFTELEARYEAAHPGVDIRLNLAGSDTLRRQIDDEADADVFAPAAVELFDGLDVEPTVFASTRIVLIGTDESLVDRIMANDVDGLLVARCAAGVPCGDAAQRAIDQGSLAFSEATVTFEPNVRAVYSKVVLGEADLGFVYVSDVVSAGVDVDLIMFDVPVFTLEDEPSPSVLLGVAALTDSGDTTHEHATGFVALVTGPEGVAVFDSLGFDPAP